MNEALILFTRQEGLHGITQARWLKVGFFRELPEKPIEHFERALSKWAAETDDGKIAFEESSEDFNIGDYLGSCFGEESLDQFLAEEGIAFVEGGDFDAELNFDRVLIQTHDEA